MELPFVFYHGPLSNTHVTVKDGYCRRSYYYKLIITNQLKSAVKSLNNESLESIGCILLLVNVMKQTSFRD
jgi:hypothetical protein